MRTFFSPFRYPGGKTHLAGFLAKMIEGNFTENDKVILVEPYAGGAGASLFLLFADKVDKIIINDLDRAIYAFWEIAVSDTDYLIDKVLKTKITIEEWKRQREIYNSPSPTMHELAFATLFMNRANRSGIIGAGPVGGMEQSGEWKLDARFIKNNVIEKLNKIKNYSNKIKVYNLDGIALSKKLEQDKRKHNYFIFLDPPYYRKGKSLYLNHYSNDDHRKLAEFLVKSQLKWVMTYDDVSYINRLYVMMRKRKFVTQHNAYKSKKGREVMIFSDSVSLADVIL